MTMPKFRAWLKDEYRMTDVREITFFDDEVQMISDVTDFYTYGEFEFMQSIGLIDENGKEIFEGDIVKDGGEDVGVVVYDKECGAYGLKYKSNVILTFENIDELGDWKGSAVIGNIYENPELLEEE